MAKKANPKSVKGQGRITAPAPAPKPSSKKSTTPKRASKGPSTVALTSGNRYIRNLHMAAGGSRIDLDHVDVRIHLEPRGQRGDMRLVTQEMIDDPMYQHNLGLLFEEISVERGKEIIHKQATNQQQAGPSTMDLLTNEFGEKYTQTRATVTPSYEEQSVTVASLAPGADGKNTERNVDITRAATPTDFFGNNVTTSSRLGPEEVEVPGSRPVFNPDVLPQWLSTEQAVVFVQTPREARQSLIEEWVREVEEGAVSQLNVSYGEVNEE